MINVVAKYLRLLTVEAVIALLLCNNASTGGGVAAEKLTSDGEPAFKDSALIVGRELQNNVANWDINYLGIDASLGTDSTNEFVMNFEIGKDHSYATQLLASDCTSDITNMTIIKSELVRTNKNADHDSLSVGYNIDKSQIVGSNIWNATISQLEFCHLIQLSIPTNGGASVLVITEKKRVFTIDVDLSVNFSFNQTLTVPTPTLKMAISSNVTVGNTSVPLTRGGFDQTETVFEKTVLDVIKAGLSQGQKLISATVRKIDGNDVRVRDRALIVDTNLHSDDEARKLQAGAFIINYDIVLEEACKNEAVCNELVKTTTMYENVTGYIIEQIGNGNFTTIFRAYAQKLFLRYALITLGRFADPAKEVDVPGAASSVSGSADVVSYVESCKCDGAQSFTCNNETLFPNSELSMCIWSVKPDEVEVNYLNSMLVSQDNTAMVFIENDQVSLPSITRREYVPDKHGVVVTTRVPINYFSFEDGKNIAVTGVMEMKLTGDGDRKLQVAITSDGSAPGNKSPFTFKVELSPGMSFVKEATFNSAVAAAGKSCIASLVIVFGFTYILG